MRVFGMDCKIVPLLFVLLVVASGKPALNSIEKTGFEARIAGGREVSQGELPYQLSLQSRGRHICGASLINVHGIQLAITAAHCVMKINFLALHLVAGDLNLNDSTGLEQRRQVVSVFLHEDYDGPHRANDLALLFLDSEFIISDIVHEIALPEMSGDVSEDITVSGWGWENSIGSISGDLRAINLTVVDRDACKEMWQNNPEPVEIGEGIICLSSLNEGGAPCRGDSGGPAVDQHGSGVLVGVVSFGDDSCPSDYPTGFTYLSRYMDWIAKNVDIYANGKLRRFW